MPIAFSYAQEEALLVSALTFKPRAGRPAASPEFRSHLQAAGRVIQPHSACLTPLQADVEGIQSKKPTTKCITGKRKAPFLPSTRIFAPHAVQRQLASGTEALSGTTQTQRRLRQAPHEGQKPNSPDLQIARF